MALYENQTTSSLADLISKLNTFATTAGAGNADWNADRHVPGSGEWAISRTGTYDDVQIATQWDTATPGNVGIYHYNDPAGAGNYDGAKSPWQQDGDSGNGAASTSNGTIVLQRVIQVTNAPLQYWAFAGRSPVSYLYVVIEVATNEYRHFGFGELVRFNDWTGGAFCYGYRWEASTGNSNIAIDARHSVLLDGLATDSGALTNMEEYAATLHIEGLPNQAAGGMWGVCLGNQPQANLGTDRQSNNGSDPDADREHIVGGFRGGDMAEQYGPFPVNVQQAFVPGYPILCYYRTPDPAEIYPLGVMDGVRGVNMDQFTDGQEVVIGSDTWVVFSSRYKSAGNVSGGGANSGIMYRKN